MNTNCRLVEEKIGFYLWKQRIDECHKKIRGAIVACDFGFNHFTEEMSLWEDSGRSTYNKRLNVVYWEDHCQEFKSKTFPNGFLIDRVTSLNPNKKTQHKGFLEPPTEFDKVFYKYYIDDLDDVSDSSVNSEYVYDKIRFRKTIRVPIFDFLSVLYKYI